MGIRSHALCITLLATLSVVDASAETRGFEVTAGEMELVFSPKEVSSLPLDAGVIAEHQCKGGRAVPLGQCRLKVGTQGEGNTIGIEVSSPTPLEEVGQSLLWQVTGLGTLSVELVESSCGAWEVSLIFDEIDSQPKSMMILEPSAQIPGKGLFASVLKMRVRLRLVNQVTEETVEYPLVLGIVLGGPWVVSPYTTSTKSNLSLLPDRKNQCFPVKVLESPDEWDGSLAGVCQFCFEGPESSTGRSF